MDLVLKLREMRRLSGLSQKKTAKLSGVNEKTISSFETGERINSLKLVQLQSLLAAYGVTEEEFFSSKFELDLERGFNPLSFRLHAVNEKHHPQ